MKRLAILIALVAACAVGVTLLFEAERLRPRVRASLERALNRKVDVIGRIDYKWLTGPGLEVTDVVIHEDPRLGLEPIAYVTSLEATPRWLSLLRGRIEFSTLRLVDPSVNLSRSDAGEVNVQPFLYGLFTARDSGTELPEIKVRGGRLNFRQGLRKAVFYLTSMDLDLRPTETNGFIISLATEAARTDRPPAGYGSFSGQGRFRLLAEREPELDLTLDLDRSPLGDLLVLFEGRRVDLAGRVSARARISGPLSRLEINGRFDLEGFQRWSLPGYNPGAVTLYYRGRADLASQTVEIETVRDEKTAIPANVRFRARRLFSHPQWGIVAAAEELPLALLVDIARAIGFRLPDNVTIPGTAAGAIGFSSSHPTPRGGFVFSGENFEGEYRVMPAEDKPHRLRVDAEAIETGDLRAKGVRIRGQGRQGRWEAAIDCTSIAAPKDLRNLRASIVLEVGPDGLWGSLLEFHTGDLSGSGQLLPDNRFVLSLADGTKLSGRTWPPTVEEKRR